MYTLQVNGISHTVDVPGDKPLLWVLRENLKLTGSKYGCGQALCGACTVHLDGHPVRACVTPISAVGEQAVRTIEDIAYDAVGAKVQETWQNLNVPQCGYCQSGQIMAATALLTDNPTPTDRDIDEAMSGNICRCGTYPRIRRAIHKLANGGV
ncbi:(2Fe-2S)-binding protein [Spongiibacter sp. KMU-158]|uniref:(2Fe-2S)-binding protein n=1 Tax=Spongiibacter pelagi TaxID=2760804 RepID=A0A927C0M3_9GAMM|nr:(2Fe-2S)-binding protein [Spongiibacter pelagi]MBD2857993.1 (2Fe-2S)-binding protein [Spongiibacter pelagi]